MIEELFEVYKISIPKKMRILAEFTSLINEAYIIAMFYKFLYEIPRPNQLDQNLKTLVCTAYHPTYPGAHALVGGAIVQFLSQLFPQEKNKLDMFLNKINDARLYGGVHFNSDNVQGNRLGRKIGKYIAKNMIKEKDENGDLIYLYENPTRDSILDSINVKDKDIYKCKSLIHQKSFKYSQLGVNYQE